MDALGLLAAEHSTTSSGHGGDGDEPTPSAKLNALLSSRVIPFFEELTDDKLRTAIMNSSLLKDSSSVAGKLQVRARAGAQRDPTDPCRVLSYKLGPPNPPCSVDALLPARVCCGRAGPLARPSAWRCAGNLQLLLGAPTDRGRGPIPDAEHG